MLDPEQTSVKAPTQYRGLSYDPVLSTLVETIGSEFRTPVVLLAIHEKSEPHIAVKTGIVGLDAEKASHLAMDCVQRRQSQNVRDIRRLSPKPEHGTPRGIRFFAASPLINEDHQAIGALFIGDSKPRRFGQSALTQLERFSTLAYAALTRSYYAAHLEQRFGEIEKLKQRNESILTASVDGIASFEPIRSYRGNIEDYKLIQFNPAFERLVHKNKTDLQGATLIEAFPKSKDMGLFERLQNVAETGRPIEFEQEYRTGAIDDWFRITAVATGSKGVTVTLSSIKERKLHEISLERANAKLRQFSVAVAHDLKAPLRHLQGFGRIVKSRLAVTALNEDLVYLDELDKAADRLKAMLDGLLDYTMLSNQNSDPGPCDLQDCAQQALKQLNVPNDEVYEIAIDHLPRVNCDENQLVRVFQNLFDNAHKYKSDQPLKVCVTGRANPYQCVVTIRDNGIGIAPDYKDKIFELFTRLPEAQDQAQGSGIGLPMCRQMIEANGGSLSLLTSDDENEEDGETQGATFEMRLPIAYQIHTDKHKAA